MHSLSHRVGDDAADAVSLAKDKGTTVGFDDINVHKGGGSVEIPDNYEKLSWNNMDAMDPAEFLRRTHSEGSGWFKGVTSGTQAAYNESASECSLYSANKTFSLTSVELTAGWDKSLTVEVVAYDKNFDKMFDQKFAINDLKPTLVTLNLTGIHELEFITSKEKADPVWAKKGYAGSFVIFDDFKFPAAKAAHLDGQNAFAHSSPGDAAHHFAFGPLHSDLHPLGAAIV